MKFYALIALFLGIFMVESPKDETHAQKTIAVCGMDQFADDPSFLEAHPYVRPIAPFVEKGKMIQIDVEGGEKANVYEVKAGKESNQYLILVHEWWGLNDNIKEQADKLAKDMPHVNMLAIDLYDGKVATSPEDARKYMRTVQQDRAFAVIEAARKYAGEGAEFATIGWCFGGAWSLQTAIALDKQLKGCVMFYGMPEQDVERLKTLKSDVMGIFAKKDGYITPKVVDEFSKNMEAAGKKVTVYQFDADHGFANPSGARYNKAAAEKAYDVTLAYLQERLPNG